MNITLQKLFLTNFKGHAELEMEFGEITQIKGHNGAGKSSVGQAITWCLYGTDTNGTKLDPTPTDREVREVKAKILIEVDGKPFLFGREIASGKNKFYINEIPQKATEYNTFVEQLFDKNLFLAMFTPTFFFAQHWEKQREQLLSFVSEPTNKDILAELPKLHQDRMPELLKKHSLDDLDKMHRDNKNKTDKELQRLDGMIEANENSVKQAQEAAASLDSSVTIDELYEEANKLQSVIDGAESAINAQREYDRKLNHFEMLYTNKGESVKRESQRYSEIKGLEATATCTTCGQELVGEAAERVHVHHEQEVQKQFARAREAVTQYKEIEEKLNEHKAIPRPEAPDLIEVNKLLSEVSANIRLLQNVERTQKALDEVRAKHKEVAKTNGFSDTMISLIKDFRAKQAEITARKVAGLFKTLSVRLYNVTKEGVQKPTFEIEMNDKPYSVLSTAERIKAGLELIGVLSGQSGVVAPVFVDNAESVLDIPFPAGQLIEARVERKKFKVETSTKGVLVNE